jgi:hypothetical protein
MDRLSTAFVGLIVISILVDMTFNGAAASLFLTREFMSLIKLVAFWR